MGRRPVPGEDSEFEGDEEALAQFQAQASAKREKLLTSGGCLQNGNGYPRKSRSSNSRLELPAAFSLDSHRSDLSRSPRGSMASTSSLRRAASERSPAAFGASAARFSTGGWSARSMSSSSGTPRRRSSSPTHSRFDQLYSLHRDRLSRFAAGEEELDPPSPTNSARAEALEALTERLYTEELKKREEKRQQRERQKEEELARQTPFSPTISQGRARSPPRPGQRQLELYGLSTELAEKRKQLQDKNVQREQERICEHSVHRNAREANHARLYEEAKEKKQRIHLKQMEKEAAEMQRLQAGAVPKKIVKSRQEEEEVIDRLLHPEPRRRLADQYRAEESKWLDPALRRPSVGSPKARRPKAARTASPPGASALTTPKTRSVREFLKMPSGKESSPASPKCEQQTDTAEVQQADASEVPPEVEQGTLSQVLPEVQQGAPPRQVQAEQQEPVPRRMTPELQQEHMRRLSREVQLEVQNAVQQVQQALQHAQLAPLDSNPRAVEKLCCAAEASASEEARKPAEVAHKIVEANKPEQVPVAPTAAQFVFNEAPQTHGFELPVPANHNNSIFLEDSSPKGESEEPAQSDTKETFLADLDECW
eukprot:TRINITY_DN88170_c0_g1_i1.p1 TRINITY_DN88170_c0_g1~~TRINITY_DN88170_c0_g1_i1.p1  ORF type:complete len:597 (+),score=125.57 TRINITY_DN88170_c0_g1_i1:74-1864(+)